MLYLGIERNAVVHRGLPVMAGGGLAAARPLGFLVTCPSSCRGTSGTAAQVHTVIPQYYSHDASLEPNLAVLLYIRLHLVYRTDLNSCGV